MSKFSLVIPCYNEADNLPLLVDRCEASFIAADVEVVLVDNGSADATADYLSNRLENHPFIRAVRVEVNQGYGFGILSGLRAAKGEILAWTHADLQTDPHDVLQGFALFKQHGPDIFVKGRRYGRPVADVLFTAGMSFFETLLLYRPLWDINAQPTIFNRQFFETWQAPPHDFSLDLYAYYRACQAGLAIHRFPVRFGARAHGVSHWNINWQAKVKFIRRTLAYSFELKNKLNS